MNFPRTHDVEAQQGQKFRSQREPEDDSFRDILAEKLADDLFELEMDMLIKYKLDEYDHNPQRQHFT